MTILTIDYNNDEIRVSDHDPQHQDDHGTVLAKGAWCVTKLTTALLYEVVNATFKSEHVRLDEISEDRRTTWGEW